ncbi:MAG TPA: hypothetical protein VE959_28725 [Bryobacteraceae bacterium]|nr:hypothetical protein [Bryobacteraceae bacterium]
MSFQWLELRISEEKDRRRREAEIMQRLPRALDEVRHALVSCLKVYTQAFGAQSADLQVLGSKILIVFREEKDGKWEQRAKVEVASDTSLPGFQIDRGGEPLSIEVGILPTDKVFYRDREQDQYVTMEELTRRILDRVCFPKLGE